MKIRPKKLLKLTAMSSFVIAFSSTVVSEEKNSNDVSNSAVIANANNIIPIMDSYYKQLNKQLDRHVKNRVRDPFSSPFTSKKQSDEIRFKPQSPAKSSVQNQPNLKQKSFSSLPAMSFRGVTESNGKKLALLEIEGLGTFVVKKGDKVGLQQVVSSGAVLHILEINNLNLIVETGSYGQQMVVQ